MDELLLNYSFQLQVMGTLTHRGLNISPHPHIKKYGGRWLLALVWWLNTVRDSTSTILLVFDTWFEDDS